MYDKSNQNQNKEQQNSTSCEFERGFLFQICLSPTLNIWL